MLALNANTQLVTQLLLSVDSFFRSVLRCKKTYTSTGRSLSASALSRGEVGVVWNQLASGAEEGRAEDDELLAALVKGVAERVEVRVDEGIRNPNSSKSPPRPRRDIQKKGGLQAVVLDVIPSCEMRVRSRAPALRFVCRYLYTITLDGQP